MNVYNEAHNLAKAIKECDELKQYVALKKEIDANEELAQAIADFQSKQMEFQLSQMSGKEPDAEATSKIQELYAILMRDPKAAEYLQAEMRFSMMMNDVYKILSEAIAN